MTVHLKSMKTNGIVKKEKRKDERRRRGGRRGKGRRRGGIICEQSEVYCFFTHVSTTLTVKLVENVLCGKKLEDIMYY